MSGEGAGTKDGRPVTPNAMGWNGNGSGAASNNINNPETTRTSPSPIVGTGANVARSVDASPTMNVNVSPGTVRPPQGFPMPTQGGSAAQSFIPPSLMTQGQGHAQPFITGSPQEQGNGGGGGPGVIGHTMARIQADLRGSGGYTQQAQQAQQVQQHQQQHSQDGNIENNTGVAGGGWNTATTTAGWQTQGQHPLHNQQQQQPPPQHDENGTSRAGGAHVNLSLKEQQGVEGEDTGVVEGGGLGMDELLNGDGGSR